MNSRVLAYAALMLLGVFISAIAQVLLKKAAMRPHGSLLEEYLDPRVLTAYAIFFAATFLSIFAYRVVPLSMGAMLEATGYIYVTAFGVLIFGEKMTGLKFIALALILAGVVVYAAFG